MWGFVEKAKQAAAQLDQQLNESVGAESGPAAAAAPSASSDDAANVWNDDDFKFDDDEEEAVLQEEAAETPTAPSETTPLFQEDAVASVPPPPVESTPPPAEQPAPEVEKDTGNSWAEDDNAFDNFDGVAPSASQEPPKEPISPKEGLVKMGIHLGGLAAKMKEAVPAAKIAARVMEVEHAAAHKAQEINFMSPLSSLMTSISHDQQEKEPPQVEVKAAPESPMKTEETKPLPVETPEPAASREEITTDSAWQEDDIDLADDSEAPEEDKAGKSDSKEEEEVKEETAAVKEEKKSEEKPEEPKQEEKPVEVPKEETQAVEPQPTAAEAVPTAANPEEPSQPAAPTETTTSTAPKTEGGASNAELEQVKTLLAQREEQLAAKAEQMFQLQSMFDKEKQDLLKKLENTKEEAKKRILKARERCETAESKLQASTSALTEDAAQQAQLVAALREEGEKLARKQAEMEKTVRAARGEARGLQEQLEDETAAKEDALAKIETLQADLKSKQEQLSSARKGETQAGKLDTELQAAKEDIANKENAIMSLEQSVKELKQEKKNLQEEVEFSQQNLSEENLRESKKLRKEHNAAVSDLEAKLQTSEREAAVREDQLRHEVEELRKRWQDAVRRADALSMDVQSSTAPLLRQLESMERQHRARASAAAELETKLRAELEETVIQNERLTKDSSEMKTKHGRLERLSKEQQSDLADRQKTIDDMTAKIARLEEKLQNLQIEGEKRQEEYEKVERLANEGVSKVRSEMSQAVLDSEERYRSQLETMKEELRIEQEKRSQLEQQVDELLENAAVIVPNPDNELIKDSKPAKLVESEGQASILSGALKGLGGDSDEDNYTDDEDLEVPGQQLQRQTSTGSSYAALEQLTQNLKAAKKELETLRKRLAESEKTRESLVEELGESREAKEKLPLFEAKVKELMADNREKELEIRGLQDDISDVKEMYRSQLNVLLEEKAAAFAEAAKKELNGKGNESAAAEEVEEPEKVPELLEDALPGLS